MRTKSNAARLIVRLAFLIGLIAPLLVLAGAVGTKFGLINYKLGFQALTLHWAWLAAIVGVAAGVVGLLAALRDFGRLGLAALVGLAASGAVLGGLWRLGSSAAALPPTHDVSTNWEDPVNFSRGVMAERYGADAAVEADPRVAAGAPAPWAGRRVAEINAETCPGAKPLAHAVDVEIAAKVLEDNGVQVTAKQAPFRVEGVAESTWFGFKDDIAVRIRPERTDIRSTSRADQPDYGSNCRRVSRIIEALNRQSPPPTR